MLGTFSRLRNLIFPLRSALHFATRRSNLSLLNFLLEKGANANAVDSDGNTPLHWASIKGAEGDGASILKILIAKTLENVDALNNYHVSPIMFAAMQGELKIVNILLEYGPNLETVDLYYGKSCLHWAALKGHVLIVKALIAKNAKVNSLDKHDQTPLISASWKGYYDVAQVLLENGGNKSQRNCNGKTALDLAYDHKCRSLLQRHYLKQKFSALASALSRQCCFCVSHKPKVLDCKEI